MSFYREEYADHGRPYGGRAGGEIGHQRPQPARRRPAGGVDRMTAPDRSSSPAPPGSSAAGSAPRWPRPATTSGR